MLLMGRNMQKLTIEIEGSTFQSIPDALDYAATGCWSDGFCECQNIIVELSKTLNPSAKPVKENVLREINLGPCMSYIGSKGK